MSNRTGAVRRHPTAVAGLVSVVLISGIGWIASSPVAGASSNAVIEWNAAGGASGARACLSPGQRPVARGPDVRDRAHRDPRTALNAIDRRYEPYTYDAQAPAGTSADAAVAAAAHAALGRRAGRIYRRSCSRRRAVKLESRSSTPPTRPHWRRFPNGTAKSQGIAVGEAAAAAIVALRSDDHANDAPLVDTTTRRGRRPGEYKFTPGTPFAFAPKWGSVTPFALTDSSQFASGPPYPLTSKRYADDYNEVKRLGADGTERTRRPDRDRQVLGRELAARLEPHGAHDRGCRGLDLWDSARLFGLLNMGMTDGYIGTFQEKYVYNFWRPVTAIHEAATDGNTGPRLIRTGSRSCRHRRSPITTRVTASKAAWPRRSCARCSAPTRSTSTCAA